MKKTGDLQNTENNTVAKADLPRKKASTTFLGGVEEQRHFM